MAIWITGLPGSGKSTIADAINKLRPDFEILRMDDLRKIVTPKPVYSDSEREIVYRSLVYFANTLTELGHNVIIDATGNKKSWRKLARQLIPQYAEIYLKCSIEECSKREKQRKNTHSAPTDIYSKGEKGWPVPGINAPYEAPDKPEIVIESGRLSVKETVAIIDEFLKNKFKSL